MLKIDLKKMRMLFTTKEIGEFLENNFFNLKTTDVIRLRQLGQWSHHRDIEFTDNFYGSFDDKQSIFSLALLMVQKRFGDDVDMDEVMRGDIRYWTAFWKFARRIADHRADKKTMSRTAKCRWNKKNWNWA